MRFKVVAPASSANLGPGFDSMALALACYLTVEVRSGSSAAENAQQIELGDGEDLVLHSMSYLASSLERPLPPARVRTESDIPVARGMGSSAAAIIAGMLAANTLLGDPLSESQLLKVAMDLEGHADNLASALFGGAVLAVPVGSDQKTFPLAVKCDLKAALFIPSHTSLTVDARAAVPTQVSREDAVFNASRCALLVHALGSGRPELLREAMCDRLHQPYRAALYPYLNATIDAAVSAGAYGASLSGSGPTVLALVDESRAVSVGGAMQQTAHGLGVPGEFRVLDLEENGATVRVE